MQAGCQAEMSFEQSARVTELIDNGRDRLSHLLLHRKPRHRRSLALPRSIARGPLCMIEPVLTFAELSSPLLMWYETLEPWPCDYQHC